uniref:RING-H2 finger protein ATL56-like n=1 Tax=Nicotiana tabacum TaxID=4097 RepID=A0A1S4AM58_TOBAC|nr:RING-H2 finger protein ATL56-like [Nicotiana tomentosiformis]XP_016477729.1 PREDICTED: RING-H2 finger protein ATL56-like [Nicotiana tabacum]
MPALTKFFSHFHELINILFYSWLPKVLRFLVLVSLVSASLYVQRQEKHKCRKIINKKSSKFVYKKRKLLGLAATEPHDCAICLCEFEHGDKGRKIESCSHMFHENCLDKWLIYGKGQATCPLCRSAIIPENMMEDHRKVEDEGLTFTIFEEELALLLLSGLSNGCCTQWRF